MGTSELKQDLALGAAKTAPALFGIGMFKVTLNEWVAIFTIGYIILQSLLMLRKHYLLEQKIKRENND